MSREIIYNKVNGQNKKLIIYGTGITAMEFLDEMKIAMNNIFCFMETNPKESSCHGYPLYSIKDLKEIDLNENFIVVASSYYPAIIEELKRLGLVEQENFVHSGAYTEYIETVDENRIINGKKIGRYSYGVMKHVKNNYLKEIGSFCTINKDAKIGPINHPLSWVSTNPIIYRTIAEASGEEFITGILDLDQGVDTFKVNEEQPIIIKNDVWIGTNTLILPGVEIGNGAIIAGGAVVTKDVPDYAVVGGVPAKVIKYRFTKEEIEQLLEIKWWDWPIEKIKENVELFRNPKTFLEHYKK